MKKMIDKYDYNQLKTQIITNDPELIILDFTKCPYFYKSLILQEEILEALKTNTIVKQLTFYADEEDHRINLGMLGTMLKVNKVIEHLDIFSFNSPASDYEFQSFCEGIDHSSLMAFSYCFIENLSNSQLETLLNTFAKNKSLKKLSCIGLGSAGELEFEDTLILLCDRLKSNPFLEELNLSNFNTDAESWTNKMVAAVADLIQKSALLSLNLSDNELENTHVDYLSTLVGSNCTLEILDLSSNNLTKALKTNISLTSLNLGYNEIGDAGVRGLSEALKTKTTLTSLDLEYNHIGDAGAIELSEALKTNTSLTYFNLEGNQIGNAGTEALCEALKSNFTLLKIDGIGDWQYYPRNNDIASCLKPITAFMEDAYELDGKDIETKLVALEEIIQSVEEESSYLEEGYRLLTILGHMTNPGSEIDALQALLLPLTHHNFQKPASFALAKLLCGDINSRFSQNHFAVQKTKSLLILQGFKEHLHRPELLHFAYIALFELLNPGQKLFLNDFNNLKNTTALINQKTLWALVKGALIDRRTREQKNSHEIELLETLLQQKNYHPLAAHFLMRSPAFIAEFKKEYPKAVSFTLPEHCLFIEPDENNFLIILPKAVASIEESLKTDYATAIFNTEVKFLAMSEQAEVIHIREEPFKESQLGPYNLYFNPSTTTTSNITPVSSIYSLEEDGLELSHPSEEEESDNFESRPGF